MNVAFWDGERRLGVAVIYDLPALPRIGDDVQLDSKQWRVHRVEWVIGRLHLRGDDEGVVQANVFLFDYKKHKREQRHARVEESIKMLQGIVAEQQVLGNKKLTEEAERLLRDAQEAYQKARELEDEEDEDADHS